MLVAQSTALSHKPGAPAERKNVTEMQLGVNPEFSPTWKRSPPPFPPLIPNDRIKPFWLQPPAGACTE